jgi:uncharacterized membrane protein YqjE
VDAGVRREMVSFLRLFQEPGLYASFRHIDDVEVNMFVAKVVAFAKPTKESRDELKDSLLSLANLSPLFIAFIIGTTCAWVIFVAEWKTRILMEILVNSCVLLVIFVVQCCRAILSCLKYLQTLSALFVSICTSANNGRKRSCLKYLQTLSALFVSTFAHNG